MGGSDLGGKRAPFWDPAEGPFPHKPQVPPPRHRFGGEGRWEQVSTGEWYAFYTNLGPGEEYCYEHPDDPNWWANKETDPEARDLCTWACRHGHWTGTGGYGVANCGSNHPLWPDATPPPTDEEVEQAGRQLADLLASMESKQR